MIWDKPETSRRLETVGWKESVAGDDFSLFVDAVVKAMATPNKGVIVSGDYGCGKTSAMKALLQHGEMFMNTIFDMNVPENVQYLDMSANASGMDYIFNQTNAVLIDDLGAESLINNYGIKRDLVGEFICRLHTRGGIRLFITTNLRGDEIADRYSGRVASRLKDLCVPVRFKGGDKREWVL